MTTDLSSPPASSFTPEPGLPWLRQDPARQCPSAFHGMRTLTLAAKTYAPMGRHYPGGTTLALTHVSSPEHLTEGVYWLERTHHQTNGVAPYTRYAFGRYAGLTGTSDERARARRLKRGQLHVELEADVLTSDLRSRYLLREDGTETCYVDFTDANFQLWRVSHYVDLPAELLAQLPASVAAQAGLTPLQQRWLREEQQVRQGLAEEYRVQLLGSLPDEDQRVVLSGEQLPILNSLFDNAKPLSYSQAKKCKAGAVAITSRSFYTGKVFLHTEYYKQQEVAVLLDWFTSLVRLQRAEEAARALAARNKAAWQLELARLRQQAAEALEEVAQVPTQELALAA